MQESITATADDLYVSAADHLAGFAGDGTHLVTGVASLEASNGIDLSTGSTGSFVVDSAAFNVGSTEGLSVSSSTASVAAGSLDVSSSTMAIEAGSMMSLFAAADLNVDSFSSKFSSPGKVGITASSTTVSTSSPMHVNGGSASLHAGGNAYVGAAGHMQLTAESIETAVRDDVFGVVDGDMSLTGGNDATLSARSGRRLDRAPALNTCQPMRTSSTTRRAAGVQDHP